MKKLVLAAAAATAVFAAAPAYADQLCKSVRIDTLNNFAHEIRIRKINYFDQEDARWRTNDIRNTVIQRGRSRPVTETLEYVGNERLTHFQLLIDYKRRPSDDWTTGRWTNISSDLVDRCVKGARVALQVTSLGRKR